MPDSNQPAADVLEQLIREREPRLRAMARAAAGPDADDAFQNACVGFITGFDPETAYNGLDGAQRYLETAIFNAGRRLSRSEFRRERAFPRAEPRADLDPLETAMADTPGPEARLLRRADAETRLAQLRELPDEWRSVLIYREIGYEPAEIQEALGLSARQYRKRVENANRRLAG